MGGFLRRLPAAVDRARLPRPARDGDARDAGDRHRRHRARLRRRRAARRRWRRARCRSRASAPGPGAARGAALRARRRAPCSRCCARSPRSSGRWSSCARSASARAPACSRSPSPTAACSARSTPRSSNRATRARRARCSRPAAARLGALFYALVPSTAQELASYTVYRWECAVRASVVMGFVGAGGLGQLMDQSMKMLNGGEASTILLIFLLLVVARRRAERRHPQACWHERRPLEATARTRGRARRHGRAPPRRCRAGPASPSRSASSRRSSPASPTSPSTTAQLFSGESMRLMAKFVGRVLPARPRRRRSSPRRPGARCRPSPSPRIGTLLAVGAARALALPAAGRFGLAPRLAARLRAQRAAQRARAGLGGADGDRRRPRPLRRHARAGAAHHRRARPALRREPGERAAPRPSARCAKPAAAAVAAFAYATLPLRHRRRASPTRSTASR